MSKNLLAFAGAAACFLLTGAVVAEPVAVTVDTTRPGATINRHIFGQFAEHLGRGVYEVHPRLGVPGQPDNLAECQIF